MERGNTMERFVWDIGEISYAGDCEDSRGHKIMNGSSYLVQLISHAERLNVQVGVTKVASSYAVERLHETTPAGELKSREVGRELVRCFVEEELNDEQWNPAQNSVADN
jgi:hypothetical protein